MSGGIDCCVTARLLNLANIPTTVVMMPYGNSMELSNDRLHAKKFINKFRLNSSEVDITQTVNELTRVCEMGSYIDDRSKNTYETLKIEITKEAISNIKPRVRMTKSFMSRKPLALAMGIGTSFIFLKDIVKE